MNFSSNLTGNSNDEPNFPHKLLLADTQIPKNRKAFANSLLANEKFKKICCRRYSQEDLIFLIL